MAEKKKVVAAKKTDPDVFQWAALNANARKLYGPTAPIRKEPAKSATEDIPED